MFVLACCVLAVMLMLCLCHRRAQRGGGSAIAPIAVTLRYCAASCCDSLGPVLLLVLLLSLPIATASATALLLCSVSVVDFARYWHIAFMAANLQFVHFFEHGQTCQVAPCGSSALICLALVLPVKT